MASKTKYKCICCGYDETDAAVLETVDLVKNHPLVPNDVVVKGYIMDSTTGELTPIEG